MSRIGMQPIEIPKGVNVTLSGQDGARKLAVKGPKGQLEMPLHPLIEAKQEGSQLVFSRPDDSRPARAAHGLVRALAANLVHGVSQGFERRLEINGVGYRAEVSGERINFQLGYSHPIEFQLPKGVSAVMQKNILTITGIDKQELGAVAAKIRSFRPPEPYKGKGIKYVEERILRKVGKAAG